MGKVNSKHGSYNVAKQMKKAEKFEEPFYFHHIPESQIYQDRRSLSFIQDKPKIQLEKRPHTFIIQSKDDYAFLKKSINKSWDDKVSSQGGLDGAISVPEPLDGGKRI